MLVLLDNNCYYCREDSSIDTPTLLSLPEQLKVHQQLREARRNEGPSLMSEASSALKCLDQLFDSTMSRDQTKPTVKFSPECKPQR